MNQSRAVEGQSCDTDTLNGALDTLGCVFRTMGDVSFPLDLEGDTREYAALCGQFACHVEHGGAVSQFGIPVSDAIGETFAVQKKIYEEKINELNERMSVLRQDLVAIREEMKRDPLTDVYNRRAFDTAIVQSLNMRFILSRPFTLSMIDLDGFKTINDKYGHAAGLASMALT